MRSMLRESSTPLPPPSTSPPCAPCSPLQSPPLEARPSSLGTRRFIIHHSSFITLLPLLIIDSLSSLLSPALSPTRALQAAVVPGRSGPPRLAPPRFPAERARSLDSLAERALSV
jgi:hypothetical protein